MDDRFVKLPIWALEWPGMNGARLKVYCSIRSYAYPVTAANDRFNRCTVSQGNLAKRAGVTRRQIIRQIPWILNQGLVYRVHQGPGRPWALVPTTDPVDFLEQVRLKGYDAAVDDEESIAEEAREEARKDACARANPKARRRSRGVTSMSQGSVTDDAPHVTFPVNKSVTPMSHKEDLRKEENGKEVLKKSIIGQNPDDGASGYTPLSDQPQNQNPTPGNPFTEREAFRLLPTELKFRLRALSGKGNGNGKVFVTEPYDPAMKKQIEQELRARSRRNE